MGGASCRPYRPLGSTERDRLDRLELTLCDLDLPLLLVVVVLVLVGRRAGFSDRSLRRLAERLPPVGRAGEGDGLADRPDEAEAEARGAGLADRARVRLLLRPAPLASEEEEEAEGRWALLRPRRWGVLAALAVICDDVVWCEVVDMTSLALLMTLLICIWGDGEGARRLLLLLVPLLPPPPAVGGCTGG